MSNLIDHAKRELSLAEVNEEYDGQLSKAVLELLEVFAKQGHSGMSASLAIELFQTLASYRTLTPITNHPTEWYCHEDRVDSKTPGLWQNKRDGRAFSHDGGETYYLVDDPDKNFKKSEAFLKTKEPKKVVPNGI